MGDFAGSKHLSISTGVFGYLQGLRRSRSKYSKTERRNLATLTIHHTLHHVTDEGLLTNATYPNCGQVGSATIVEISPLRWSRRFAPSTTSVEMTPCFFKLLGFIPIIIFPCESLSPTEARQRREIPGIPRLTKVFSSISDRK